MEIFDLYDNKRQPTGLTMERGNKVPAGYYRLVVHICIFRENGDMLIQRRQTFKRGWSGMWDLSLGGSVSQGEDSQITAQRELKEELGLSYDFSKETPAVTVSFHDGFDDIYIIRMDPDIGDMKLQEEEVMAVQWADCDTILEMIDKGIFIPYEKHLINYLFFLKDVRSTHTAFDRNPDPTYG